MILLGPKRFSLDVECRWGDSYTFCTLDLPYPTCFGPRIATIFYCVNQDEFTWCPCKCLCIDIPLLERRRRFYFSLKPTLWVEVCIGIGNFYDVILRGRGCILWFNVNNFCNLILLDLVPRSQVHVGKGCRKSQNVRSSSCDNFQLVWVSRPLGTLSDQLPNWRKKLSEGDCLYEVSWLKWLIWLSILHSYGAQTMDGSPFVALCRSTIHSLNAGVHQVDIHFIALHTIGKKRGRVLCRTFLTK